MRSDALICFSKTGPVKFTGHLDLLKIFQKAIRRCGLPVNFSEGFNPHLRVAFALPLALGMEGMREYVVFEMGQAVAPEEIGGRLGAVLPAGITVAGVRYMTPGEKSPASEVCAADYELRFAGADADSGNNAENGAVNGETERSETRSGDTRSGDLDYSCIAFAARALMDRNSIEVEKKSKNARAGSKTVDIRPDIYEIAAAGNTVTMRIAAGSARSLKPELVAGVIAPGAEYTCVRLELLKRAGEGFAPLYA